MIRVSHKKLEDVRANPSLLRPGQAQEEFRAGPSGMQYFKWALQQHVHGNERDDAKAADYIEKRMGSRMRVVRGRSQRCFSDATIGNYLDYLQQYVRTVPTSIPVRFQDRLTIDILGKAEIGGNIDRVDLTDLGYAVWVFEHSEAVDWMQELRFPLIQDFYAKELSASPSEIVVGVYAASAGRYAQTSFKTEAMAAAVAELHRIVRTAIP